MNDVTVKDAYPLPKIWGSLDSLSGTCLFSTLDLQSGYWQIEGKEEDRQKTAFVTRNEFWEYVTMPMGICNEPSTFERCMELVLRGLQWDTLIIYIDDVIVVGVTIEEHLERLDQVLTRLGNGELKVKPSKCSLLQEEVTFPGHRVTSGGIKPDQGKVSCIRP